VNCATCLAIEHGSQDQLRRLVAYQARQIDRLLAGVDSSELGAAHVRIVELEQIVERLNRKVQGLIG